MVIRCTPEAIRREHSSNARERQIERQMTHHRDGSPDRLGVMPDASLTTTVISTAGTLLGALGGIGLSQATTILRETRVAERQRTERRDRAREQACTDLLGAARQLCLQIEVAARCPWRDMDVRLSAIERQGAEISRHASRVAMYASPGVADAGRAIAEDARRLVALVAELTQMTYDDAGEFRGGEMRQCPDVTKFDAAVKAFDDAVAADGGS
jgi:hypothetical protein